MRPNSTPSAFALVVEGSSDKHVVRHIWFRQSRLAPDITQLPFVIAEKEGKPRLLEDIRIEATTPNRLAVGFIVDADVNAIDTWQSVRNRLGTANIRAPSALDQSGVVIEPATEFDPRIGIWIMPDNSSPGELEDFVAEMVPGNDTVWPKSKSYILNITESERRFSEKKTTRAIVHAWLAAREDPRQMGTAIRSSDLEITGELCQRFVGWLERLFQLP